MRSKLFSALSMAALTGISVTSYGIATTDTWTLYKEGDGKIPKSDCLEMICEHGCVEKNNDIGYCCHANGQCKIDNTDVDACCGEDEFCDNGTCQKKTCTFNGETYQHNDPVLDCGKCVNGSVIQDNAKTLPECRTSCNTSTWNWNNVADATKIGDCQECQNGEKVNLPDETKVDDCHVCQNGSKVNVPDGTKVDGTCLICQNGRSMNAPNGSYADECNTCRNGKKSPVTNNTKVDDCNVCKNGIKTGVKDGTKIGDCQECQNGEKVNVTDGTEAGVCQECRDGVKGNVADGTPMDDCYVCINGKGVLDEEKCPEGCPPGVDVEYASKVSNPLSKCGSRCTKLVKKGCCPLDKPKFNWVTYTCEKSCTVGGKVYAEGKMFVGGGTGGAVDPCKICKDDHFIPLEDGKTSFKCTWCKNGEMVKLTVCGQFGCCKEGEICDNGICHEPCPKGTEWRPTQQKCGKPLMGSFKLEIDSKCKETFRPHPQMPSSAKELIKKECTYTIKFPKSKGCFFVENGDTSYSGMVGACCPGNTSPSAEIRIGYGTVFDFDRGRVNSEYGPVHYKNTDCGPDHNKEEIKTTFTKSGNKFIMKMSASASTDYSGPYSNYCSPFVQIRQLNYDYSVGRYGKGVDYIPNISAFEIDCDDKDIINDYWSS